LVRIGELVQGEEDLWDEGLAFDVLARTSVIVPGAIDMEMQARLSQLEAIGAQSQAMVKGGKDKYRVLVDETAMALIEAVDIKVADHLQAPGQLVEA
jgi:hypothetical protein